MTSELVDGQLTVSQHQMRICSYSVEWRKEGRTALVQPLNLIRFPTDAPRAKRPKTRLGPEGPPNLSFFIILGGLVQLHVPDRPAEVSLPKVRTRQQHQ